MQLNMAFSGAYNEYWAKDFTNIESAESHAKLHSHLVAIIISSIAISVLLGFILLRKQNNGQYHNRLPRGNMGLPLVGETFEYLRDLKANRIDRFVMDRAAKYGPVFKTSLFGSPTVVFAGAASNRFQFSNEGKLFESNTRGPNRKIIGGNSLLSRTGDEHKRIRVALMTFLGPQSLQQFVPRIDAVVQHHFAQHWKGKESVHVVPLMRKLTFSVACSLLISVENKDQLEGLSTLFYTALKGIYTLPINLPRTRLRRGLSARSEIEKILSSILEKRKKDLQQGFVSPRQDLVSCLLTMTNDNDNPGLTDEEVIDNIVLLLFASHDTTSVTLSLMCRILARNPDCYDQMVKEQEKILENKMAGEQLTWEDIQQMNYAWRLAQETLRMTPPVSGIYRQATSDIEYGGYTVPKGWQLVWTSYPTHLSEDIFPEPEKFDPSRFEGSVVPAYCFLPFGGGPRVCPGIEFAKIVMRITMHHMVTKYRWSAVIPDEPICRNPSLAPAMGLPIKLFPK